MENAPTIIWVFYTLIFIFILAFVLMIAVIIRKSWNIGG